MSGSRAGVEAALVFSGISIFIGYHVWMLFIRGRGPTAHKKFEDFFGAGKLARVLFSEAVMSDEKEAITAVQTIRNAIMACTFVATIASIVCVALVNALLDPVRVKRIEDLSRRDPIARHAPGDILFSADVVLSLPIAALCAACVCTAQSVRLYVHLGFYVRAVTSEYNRRKCLLRREEAVAIALKAGLAFTIGLRVLYFFIPLVLWVYGPTALCVSSILLTVGLWNLDQFPPEQPSTLLKHNFTTEDEEAPALADERPLSPDTSKAQQRPGAGSQNNELSPPMSPFCAPKPASAT